MFSYVLLDEPNSACSVASEVFRTIIDFIHADSSESFFLAVTRAGGPAMS